MPQFLGSFVELNQIQLRNKSIVCFGRSNSGKSSLLRLLLNNKKIVKTSSKPGSTLHLNHYRYGEIDYIDTPGYGFAKVHERQRDKMSDLLSQVFNHAELFKCGILIMDARRSIEEFEHYIIKKFTDSKTELIIALNKIDKCSQKEMHKIKKQNSFSENLSDRVFFISARTGKGFKRLHQKLVEVID